LENSKIFSNFWKKRRRKPMRKISPYISIPVVIFLVILGSTEAFQLLSERSDWDVFLGVLLVILLIAVVYNFFKYIFNKPIE